MPFSRLLGIRVLRKHKDGVTIECSLRPEFYNLAGVLHGGVTATMADVAVGMATFGHFGRNCPITTVEMKVNYFLLVAGKNLFARARLIRVGKTLVVGRVDIQNEHRRLVGAALVTYMLLPADDKSPRAARG